MKQHRLPWLMALLLALILLRWIAPPVTPQPVAASEAVERTATTFRQVDTTVSATPQTAAPVADLPTPDEPRNAFAVRGPAMPVAAPAPARAPVPMAVEPPRSTIAVPLAPALQVIGTWNDGGQPGVFVATPHGTRLARTGDLLLAQYRVTEVTDRQLSLQDLATSRELRLAVPQAAGR